MIFPIDERSEQDILNELNRIDFKICSSVGTIQECRYGFGLLCHIYANGNHKEANQLPDTTSI